MNEPNARLRVLIVEDNDGDALLLQEALRERGTLAVEVTRATTLLEGLTALGTSEPDAVLLDLTLPDSQGLETLRRVCQHAPRSPVIIMTGLDDESMAIN